MSESDDRPLPLRVRLPFTSEEEFIRRFGANLSPTGVFIPTRTLKPEGTRLRFELVLTDGARLLRGEVQVARAREEAPGVRSGMELAFTELDAASLAFLERALRSLQQPPEQRAPRSTLPLVSAGHLLSGQMQEAGEAGSAVPPTSPRGLAGTALAPAAGEAPVLHAERGAAPPGLPQRAITAGGRGGPQGPDRERADRLESATDGSRLAVQRERADRASRRRMVPDSRCSASARTSPRMPRIPSRCGSRPPSDLASHPAHVDRAREEAPTNLGSHAVRVERAREGAAACLARGACRADAGRGADGPCLARGSSRADAGRDEVRPHLARGSCRGARRADREARTGQAQEPEGADLPEGALEQEGADLASRNLEQAQVDLAAPGARAERALELEREALAQQTAHAERALELEQELERAALAQRTARAERVEDLARASVLGADALAARTRKPELEPVFGLAVDRPDLPAARLAAGTLEWCEAPALPSPHGMRLFARRADSARVLEYASEAGLEVRADPDGLATWREDDVQQEGATWAADWLGAWASQSLLPPAAPPRRTRAWCSPFPCTQVTSSEPRGPRPPRAPDSRTAT